MINDISLSTAGCCCCRWMVARCRRRRQRRLRRAMQLPPPPFRHGENRNHDSSSRSRSGCAIITNKILSSSYLKSAFKIPFHKHCCTCQHVKTLPMENSQFYNIKASIFIINCGTFLGNLQSNWHPDINFRIQVRERNPPLDCRCGGVAAAMAAAAQAAW